jgi:hypothetical protein
MILLISVPALACMLLRTLSPKGPEVAHLRHKTTPSPQTAPSRHSTVRQENWFQRNC